MHLLGTLALAMLPLLVRFPDTVDIPAIGLVAPVSPAETIMRDDGRRTWSVPCSRSASTMSRGGNTSLFGHRDVCGGVFDDIHLLQPGDAVVYAGTNYVVDSSHVVVPTETWPIQDFGDDRLTLISCWPPGSTAQRYVVIAIRDPLPASAGAPPPAAPLAQDASLASRRERASQLVYEMCPCSPFGQPSRDGPQSDPRSLLSFPALLSTLPLLGQADRAQGTPVAVRQAREARSTPTHY